MSGIFDQMTVTQVQQANDIVDVVGEHVSLKKKGREMVGLCPFHDDHRPSLNVNVQKQIFKCFSCGAGGDVFKFVQMRENLTFPQAVERLADRAGIRLPDSGSREWKANRQSAIDSRQSIDPNHLARVNAWAAKYFQKNLYDNEKGKYARDYLTARKITDESIKKFQLGLAVDSGDDLLKQARARSIPAGLLEHAGLVTAQNQDKFVNRLMFAITDVSGRVIGFGGRTLSDEGAKYINSPTTVLFDKSNSLYGLEQARHQIVSTDTAVVVEGYTDCIMAHQSGCTNVVATLGTSFTTGHGRILRRYAKKVIVVFDSDAAGIEAANRALDVCLSQRIDIKLTSVPQGKDPCDFLLAGGKEKFQRLLDDAVDVLQFKWDRLMEKFDTDDTLAGRKAAVNEYLQTVATGIYAGTLKSIEGGLLINRLSGIIGLEAKQINAELQRIIKGTARAAAYDVRKPDNRQVDLGQGLSATAQREIIEVLLNEPKLFKNVKQEIKTDDFDVPALNQMAVILFEVLRTDPDASLKTVLAATESQELGGCFVQLQHVGQEKGNFESRLEDALKALRKTRLRSQKSDIKAIKDQARFLRSVVENTAKDNPHNLGMT